MNIDELRIATLRGSKLACDLTPDECAVLARIGRLTGPSDVVFDTEGGFIVTEDRLHYRHPVSPYLGEKFHGIVKATYLRGHLIFENGEFPGEPVGREYSGADLNKLASQPSFL